VKIKDIIDRKILFINWTVNKNAILEGVVKELSPSNNFVKINNDWYLIENLRILELFEEDKKSIGFK
jgi:hypothetical protein